MAGRPPLFTNTTELEAKIEEYFASTRAVFDEDGELKKESIPITITGLALYLGFESRQSFYDYEKHEEYSYIIRKARLQVESGYENRLHFNNPTGAIFALKNMGWKDTQQITHEIQQGILSNDPLDDTANNSPAENIQTP